MPGVCANETERTKRSDKVLKNFAMR
jgi:hypothetical protein